MTHAPRNRSAVRAKLSHPVIDGDGHWVEPYPLVLEYVKAVAGASVADRLDRSVRDLGWYGMTAGERRHTRTLRPGWWGEAGNTLDRATAMVPALLRERLDEFGIDFALIYTSVGLTRLCDPDEELRRAVARAINRLSAELFLPHASRMTPVAVVPMYTPQEAIEEATFAVRELGFKAIMIATHARRPVACALDSGTGPANLVHYIDPLALDSPHDYDPFWARCVELGVAVTAHCDAMGWEDRRSITNFTYNHIGHFANSNHAFTKALVLGGVLHRFPTLHFGVLEGGAGWAANLLADLVSHFGVRSRAAVTTKLRPTNIDAAEVERLLRRHGGDFYTQRIDALMGSLSAMTPYTSLEELTERENLDELDDFAAAGVDSVAALRRQFTEALFFGCEGEDAMTPYAFGHHPNRVRAFFGSDIGHFDVSDMSKVLDETHEMVKGGLITDADFRQFVFANVARLHTALNPNFFTGTIVEDAVASLLESTHTVEKP